MYLIWNASATLDLQQQLQDHIKHSVQKTV